MSEPLLLTIQEWTERRFAPGSAPTARTVRKWIDMGHVPGLRIGRAYYVDVMREAAESGDPTVDYVIAEVEKEREERRRRKEKEDRARQVTT